MSNYYVHTVSSFTDLVHNLELVFCDESLEELMELLSGLRVLVETVQILVCNDISEEEI